METPVVIIIAAVCAVVFAVIGFIAGGIYRKKTAESLIGSANDEAARIVSQAMNEAETKKREAILEAKDEIHKFRSESEREIRERRNEVQRQEKRMIQKEENLDKKTENLEKKEEVLEHDDKLQKVLDEIRSKYGNDKIMYADMITKNK